MPCRGPEPGDYEAMYRRQLDELTAMVCELLTGMENDVGGKAIEVLISDKLLKWWNEHKKQDAARRERERLEGIERGKQTKARLAALAKLTPSERKALGL